MSEQFANSQQIAEAGRRIYEAKYRAQLEKSHPGQFVVIDVTTDVSYPAPHPEQALKQAETESPNGKFHLIKIGAAGAFKVSYASNARRHRIFRQFGEPCSQA